MAMDLAWRGSPRRNILHKLEALPVTPPFRGQCLASHLDRRRLIRHTRWSMDGGGRVL
jgi:hypothetical protein